MKIKGTVWVTKLIDGNGEVAAIRYGKCFRKAWSVDGKPAEAFTVKRQLCIPKSDSYEIIVVK